MWMLGFSAGFAATGYLVLGVLGMGARGLVLANGVNMVVRIWWSWGFVSGWFRGEEGGRRERRGLALRVVEILPTGPSMIGGVITAVVLQYLKRGFTGGVGDLIKTVGVGGVYGICL